MSWTRRIVFTLHCDLELCSETVHVNAETVTAARVAARGLGWYSTTKPSPLRMGPAPTIDLCPSCAAKRPS